jgi:hypothetical protein
MHSEFERQEKKKTKNKQRIVSENTGVHFLPGVPEIRGVALPDR